MTAKKHQIPNRCWNCNVTGGPKCASCENYDLWEKDTRIGFTGISDEKTEHVHKWMKNLPDDEKQRFAINWKIPHSLFNVACGLYPGGQDELQNIDWDKIFKSHDLGGWGHGGPVNVLSL